MRDIKFRAWHQKVKIMSDSFNVWDMQLPGIEIDRGGILMQYTGLKDKNGVEIYEGDITNFGVIEWCENIGFDGGGGNHSGFYFKRCAGELEYHDNMDECEVIGNIYENPKLLETT